MSSVDRRPSSSFIPHPSSLSGKLSIVGTPIGNMEDITLRALRTLREADLVAAEDTRHTGQLLARHEIRKPLVSYHQFNEAQRTPELLAKLHQGQRIVLVSDAGMPTLSDPGLRLIQAVLQIAAPVQTAPHPDSLPHKGEGFASGLLSPPGERIKVRGIPTAAPTITIEVIPGVSAITAALAIAGIAPEPFLFHGFLPHKSAQRRKVLTSLAPLPCALVFFESPYRLLRALADIRDVLGNRRMAVARELTKKFEEVLRGDAETLRKSLEPRTIKGEITLVIEGNRA